MQLVIDLLAQAFGALVGFAATLAVIGIIIIAALYDFVRRNC